MSDCTEFKCKPCDGTGRGPPRFIAGGLVERPTGCIYCGSTGLIKRVVEDFGDSLLRGRRLAESYWKPKGRKSLRTILPADLHENIGLKIAEPRRLMNGNVTIKSRRSKKSFGRKSRITNWIVDEKGIHSRQIGDIK